jgi:hypothetical protein
VVGRKIPLTKDAPESVATSKTQLLVCAGPFKENNQIQNSSPSRYYYYFHFTDHKTKEGPESFSCLCTMTLLMTEQDLEPRSA